MSRLILAVAILVLSFSPLSAEISHEVAGAPPRRFAGNEEPADLEPILKKVAEYCQRLERVSLHLVCPSKYFVREEYIHPEAGRVKISETTVIYRDYKFFTVDTEVKIK